MALRAVRHPLVRAVLRLGLAGPQIVDPVVEPVAVAVIDVALGEPAMNIEPGQPVSGVIAAIEADTSVVSCLMTRDLPSRASVERRIAFPGEPSELAGLWVV